MTMTALYVLAKECLYAAPPSIGPASIKAAVYLPSKSWYRSVTKEELGMVPDTFEPFNSIPAPARPHTIEDMKASPIFVMKVRDDTWYKKLNSANARPAHVLAVHLCTSPIVL